MASYIVLLLAVCIFSCSADPVVKVGVKGKCPNVPFVKEFDASKFVGKWFAIRETGKEIPCVKYEITETEVNHYSAKVEPKGVTMEFKKNNVEDYAEGFTVSFPINPYMDGAILKVFETDYKTYAGVYTCKYNEVDDVYFQTISFWGRSNVLTDETVKSLSDVLAKYEVDESEMKVVKQVDCDVV